MDEQDARWADLTLPGWGPRRNTAGLGPAAFDGAGAQGNEPGIEHESGHEHCE